MMVSCGVVEAPVQPKAFQARRCPPRQETPVTRSHPPTYASVTDSSLCLMGAPSNAPPFEAWHWLKPASSLTGTLEGNLQTAKAKSGGDTRMIVRHSPPRCLPPLPGTFHYRSPALQDTRIKSGLSAAALQARRSDFRIWTSSKGGFLG